MKKSFLLSIFFPVVLCAEHDTVHLKPLLALLAMNNPQAVSFRASTPPSSLGTPLGKVVFQGYNGGATGPYTQGATIGGYYGLTGLPTQNQTFPANIIASTIASSGGTEDFRMSVQADGRVGIGNFQPADTTTANAALNVEGSTASIADSTMHVGSRTTALTGFTSMTGATSVNYNMQVDGNTLVANATLVNNARSSGNCNILPCTFIRSIPATGMVISTPGVYCFANNITYTPAASANAISIQTSGVVLDLQGYMLTQGNSNSNVSGVSIASGNTDIMIMNGQIQDFTHTGVVGNNTLTRIAVENIRVINCQLRAIAMIGSGGGVNRNRTIYINNCEAILCGQNGSANSIITAQSSTDVYVNNCVVTQATNATGTLNGFFFGNVINVIASDLVVANSAGPSTRGIYLSNTTNAKLLRCHALGNTTTATSSELYGLRINNSNNIEATDCCMLRNTNTMTGGFALGCGVEGTSSNILFDRCVFAGQLQTSTGASVAPCGLRINSTVSNVTVRGSVFYRNDSSSAYTPIGLECLGNNCAIVNCIAHSQLNEGATGLVGTGFRMFSIGATTGLECSFLTNNAFNQNIGFEAAITGSATGTQNQYLRNLSAKNTTNYTGFSVGSTTTSTLAGLGSITNPWTNLDMP